MKVLLTGAGGQVGRAFLAAVPPDVELVASTHAQLDIGDSGRVTTLVRALRPDVIVNAAAYTAVDQAEREAELAHRVNAAGPRNLADAASSHGARMIHLSTDFVFDGQSSRPYRPDDQANPLSVYGASKLAGERAVRDSLPERSIVLRTAWVYDGEGRNFLRTMLRLMREKGVVRVVADQIGTPTSARSVAAAMWGMLRQPELAGIHHWTDSGVASWYDFACAIADEWAQATHTTAGTVIPIGTADYPTAAKRPGFSVLDTSATAMALAISPPHWRRNLREIIGDIASA